MATIRNTPLKGLLPQDPSPAKIPIMAIAQLAKLAGKKQKADVEATKHASSRVMAGISGRKG